MLFELFITSVFIAGIAVCWRNLLSDIKSLSNFVDRLPYPLRKPLKCGFCFTYWVALVTVLISNPLSVFVLHPVVNIFVSWVVCGMLAVIIRFGYVVLQELVHYQVHYLREHDHKH